MVHHDDTTNEDDPATQVERPEGVACLVLGADALFEELVRARLATHELPATRALTLARDRALRWTQLALLEYCTLAICTLLVRMCWVKPGYFEVKK